MDNYEHRDIEKSRTEYVVRLEALMKHMQAELATYKAIAEKWQPICHAELDPKTQVARFTLSFGGKRSTAEITFASMGQSDPTTATSAIVDVLIESNVAARLREAVQPEVDKVLPNLKKVAGVGKWAA